MSQSTDRRAHRWTEHKARRQDEILDAAVAAIDAIGIDVTVQHIADWLGLPRPVVYRHFDGRADLDEQVRGRILRNLLAELLPTLRPDGTVEQAVRHAIGTYLRWVDKHPNLHHFLGTGPHHQHVPDSPVVADARNAISGQLAELFAAALRNYGADTAPARPMAFAVLGMVDGAVNGWRSARRTRLTSGRLAEHLTESLLALIDANARLLGVPVDRNSLTSTLVEVR